MKSIIAYLFFTLCTCMSSYAQDVQDNTKYSQSVSLDSSITPDYFKAAITIGEYYYFAGKGKNRLAHKVSLDSVKDILVSELRKLSFRTPVNLVKVSERDGISSSEPRFQATYEFNIYAKDSIEILYRNLSEKMPPYSLVRFKITPELTQESIKQSQMGLERTALERVKLDAQKFADSNKLSVKTIKTYQLSFTRKERFDSEYYSNQQKAYNITFADPVYSLNVYYVFSLE